MIGFWGNNSNDKNITDSFFSSEFVYYHGEHDKQCRRKDEIIKNEKAIGSQQIERKKSMNTNLAYQEDPREELLHGEIYMMSSPSVNHNRVAFHIATAFQARLKGKPCEAFADGTDVYLTDNDRVIPDVMIVCNKDIIKNDGIHGAPDLVVEVLSPGTSKNDRGYKKDLYEKSGVKEYWIVDVKPRSIETYLLTDGRYRLDGVYQLPTDDMTERDREACTDTISASLSNDFCIPLEEIFYNLF